MLAEFQSFLQFQDASVVHVGPLSQNYCCKMNNYQFYVVAMLLDLLYCHGHEHVDKVKIMLVIMVPSSKFVYQIVMNSVLFNSPTVPLTYNLLLSPESLVLPIKDTGSTNA